MEPRELEVDKIYTYGDLSIKASCDYDFVPVIYVYSDKGTLIIKPTSDNKISVQSSAE